MKYLENATILCGLKKKSRPPTALLVSFVSERLFSVRELNVADPTTLVSGKQVDFDGVNLHIPAALVGHMCDALEPKMLIESREYDLSSLNK